MGLVKDLVVSDELALEVKLVNWVLLLPLSRFDDLEAYIVEKCFATYVGIGISRGSGGSRAFKLSISKACLTVGRS